MQKTLKGVNRYLPPQIAVKTIRIKSLNKSVRRVKFDNADYIICRDLMTACGYSTTGMAREFNVYPSYRLIKLPGKQEPVAVVTNDDVVTWLGKKKRPLQMSKERILNDANINALFDTFARIKLDNVKNQPEVEEVLHVVTSPAEPLFEIQSFPVQENSEVKAPVAITHEDFIASVASGETTSVATIPMDSVFENDQNFKTLVRNLDLLVETLCVFMSNMSVFAKEFKRNYIDHS